MRTGGNRGKSKLGARIKSVQKTEAKPVKLNQRDKIIAQAMETMLSTRIARAQTLTEKRAIAVEGNPFVYAFGFRCKRYRDYLSYEENMGVSDGI